MQEEEIPKHKIKVQFCIISILTNNIQRYNLDNYDMRFRIRALHQFLFQDTEV